MRGLVFGVALVLTSAAPAWAQTVTVAQPWARATAPHAATGAAYATVTAAVADHLTGATSPVAAKVEVLVQSQRIEFGVEAVEDETPVGRFGSWFLVLGSWFMTGTVSFLNRSGVEQPMPLPTRQRRMPLDRAAAVEHLRHVHDRFLPLRAVEPEDADHAGRCREPSPMRTLVDQVVRRLKLPDQELWREELAQVWQQVVPAKVASTVRPGKWEHGVLYLYVANNARLFEFQRFHLRAVETGLRRHFDAAQLKQVRVMIDPEAGRS